jgi:hypothetical protein
MRCDKCGSFSMEVASNWAAEPGLLRCDVCGFHMVAAPPVPEPNPCRLPSFIVAQGRRATDRKATV